MTTQMRSQPVGTQSPAEQQDLDNESLAAIRDLLHSEPRVKAQPVEARVAGQQSQTGQPDQAAAAPQVSARQKRKDAKAKAPRAQGRVDGIKARVLAYRPTPKHVLVASIALLVLFRPVLVLGILFLTLLVTTGVFLILGYDGFWQRAMRTARWYAKRRPERSVELHRKLDTFAMRWDAVLDRFPEGSVDGLYLPDFGELASAESRHDEALDRRFADMREGEA